LLKNGVWIGDAASMSSSAICRNAVLLNQVDHFRKANRRKSDVLPWGIVESMNADAARPKRGSGKRYQVLYAYQLWRQSSEIGAWKSLRASAARLLSISSADGAGPYFEEAAERASRCFLSVVSGTFERGSGPASQLKHLSTRLWRGQGRQLGFFLG